MFSQLSRQVLKLPSLSPPIQLFIRLIALGVIDVVSIWLALALASDENWFLVVAIVGTTTLVNLLNLVPNFAPVRWMSPSLSLIFLFALYPFVFTLYVSFTNFKDGHRFTKIEAIDLLEQRRYLPQGEVNYYWSPYINSEGKYALWLVSADEERATFFAEQGKPLQPVIPFESGEGPYTEGVRQFPDGLPATINGYYLPQPLSPEFSQAMIIFNPINGSQKDTRFGDEENPVGISGRNEAGNYQQQWIYDEDKNRLIDMASYQIYTAQANTGQFVAADGSVAPIDFKVPFDSNDTRRSKAQAIELLEAERYLVEGAVNYQWTAYQNEAGNYALWLLDDDNNQAYIAVPGSTLREVDDTESPETIDDVYRMLNSGATMQALTNPALTETNFGDVVHPIYVVDRNRAGNYRQRWIYNADEDTFTDLTRHKVFNANEDAGDFVSADGTKAPLGYWVVVGFENFEEALTSSLVDGPLLRIFLWTVGFALGSVITSFALGLFMAVILNDDFFGVRIIRSLLLIPWAVPGMIGILIWRGLLNGEFGIIATTMKDLIHWAPPFFTNSNWAKFSILMVNLWFTYPYFMLVSSGALQSIPSSIYEAAEVDGANAWNKFWGLTLPLLLVSVGPLLIASFVFNFNNYLLIEALTEGGPTIKGTNAPPVGDTDNLMTYTYRYAFSAEGTRDFGFASAIAVMIFILVVILTLIQFRLTKRWEEVGENV